MAPLPIEQTYVWNAKKNNIDILCPALSTNQNSISNTSQMDVKIEKDEKVPAEIEIKEEFPKDEEISMDYLTDSSPISSTNSNQTKSVELSKMLGGRLTNKKQNYWLAAGGTALLKGAAAPTDPTALQTAVKMAKKDTKHRESFDEFYFILFHICKHVEKTRQMKEVHFSTSARIFRDSSNRMQIQPYLTNEFFNMFACVEQ